MADGAGPVSVQDAPQRVAFYFSAHQDDWQLFMNPSAFRDVLDGAKCVFIHMTAGDAGLGIGNSVLTWKSSFRSEPARRTSSFARSTIVLAINCKSSVQLCHWKAEILKMKKR